MPSRLINRCIRSRPSFQPTGCSSSSQRSASAALQAMAGSAVLETFQLRPVALELGALLLDHFGRRLGDEAVVGELALRTLHLGTELLATLLDPRPHRFRVHFPGLEYAH